MWHILFRFLLTVLLSFEVSSHQRGKMLYIFSNFIMKFFELWVWHYLFWPFGIFFCLWVCNFWFGILFTDNFTSEHNCTVQLDNTWRQPCLSFVNETYPTLVVPYPILLPWRIVAPCHVPLLCKRALGKMNKKFDSFSFQIFRKPCNIHYLEFSRHHSNLHTYTHT